MLDHVSLPEAVGKALRHRILNNEIPAETRLVEANLAAEFGVSRATIRDAMRSLQAEGLIAIVPRRYSVVTRMSLEDAEDVCFARYALELASLDRGFGPGRKDLVKSLRLALDHMSVAARTDDLDALVASDTLFHEVLMDVSGRRRLKDLWSGILEAVTEGDLDRLRRELRVHYMMGFPDPEATAPEPAARPDRTGDS
jgi:DNA-binding GntR family transcriptional regulator